MCFEWSTFLFSKRAFSTKKEISGTNSKTWQHYNKTKETIRMKHWKAKKTVQCWSWICKKKYLRRKYFVYYTWWSNNRFGRTSVRVLKRWKSVFVISWFFILAMEKTEVGSSKVIEVHAFAKKKKWMAHDDRNFQKKKRDAFDRKKKLMWNQSISLCLHA